jgi:hypothetical protein
MLPDLPQSLADLHLVAWLARVIFLSQGGPNIEGLDALERQISGNGTGGSMPVESAFKIGKKVKAFWAAWVERDSFKDVYVTCLPCPACSLASLRLTLCLRLSLCVHFQLCQRTALAACPVGADGWTGRALSVPDSSDLVYLRLLSRFAPPLANTLVNSLVRWASLMRR